MNFITWLLKRIKTNLIGNGTWRWVEDYRNMILRSKLESFFVTILGGLLWLLVIFAVSTFLSLSREMIQDLGLYALISVPVFYIYNWLMALYDIYDTERMATWNTLKEH